MIESIAAPNNHLAPGAEHVGTIVPHYDLWTTRFREPEGLNYLSSNFDVYASKVEGGGTRFDIAIDHPQLAADALLGLLQGIAPHPGRVSKGAVTGDWDMPGYAASLRGDNGAEYRWLAALHAYLGEPWHVFMKSLPLFREIMYNDDILHREHPMKNDLYYFCTKERWVRTNNHKVLQDALTLHSRTKERLLELLVRAGIANPDQVLSEEIEAQEKSDADMFRHRFPEITHYEFERWTPLDRVRLARRILCDRNRLDAIKQALIEETRAYMYDRVVMNDGTVLTCLIDRVGEPLQRSYDRRQRKPLGPYMREIMDLRMADDNLEEIEIRNTTERVLENAVMAPSLSWVRRPDGTGEFLFRHEPPKSCATRVDDVLGVLVVAYLSREVRRTWPEKVEIHGRSQKMGPAQVPVLALQHVDKLLRSRFIKKAERLAR